MPEDGQPIFGMDLTTHRGPAQHAFWGRGGTERQSMVHQLASRVS